MLICVTDIVLKLMFLIYAWKYFLIVIYVIQDNYFFFLYFCLPGVITFSEYLFLLTILTSMLLQLFSYKYIKLGLWCCWFCYNYVIYIVVHLYQSCIYKEVAHKVQSSVSLMFLPDFNIFCDLSLYRPSQQHGFYLF